MISSLLIHSDLNVRVQEAEKILKKYGLSKNHPCLLWLEEEKLGIETARKIKDFLSLKPYQGKNQAVVILAAENLTLDGQNALLKTLEEPPSESIILLGVSSEDQLLSTIISRCQTINIQNTPTPEVGYKYEAEIEKLLESNTEERFKYIEKLKERGAFLTALTAYFRKQLIDNIQPSRSSTLRVSDSNELDKKNLQEFLKDLIETEKWAKQNVNIRAILEYLILKLPKDSSK